MDTNVNYLRTVNSGAFKLAVYECTSCFFQLAVDSDNLLNAGKLKIECPECSVPLVLEYSDPREDPAPKKIYPTFENMNHPVIIRIKRGLVIDVLADILNLTVTVLDEDIGGADSETPIFVMNDKTNDIFGKFIPPNVIVPNTNLKQIDAFKNSIDQYWENRDILDNAKEEGKRLLLIGKKLVEWKGRNQLTKEQAWNLVTAWARIYKFHDGIIKGPEDRLILLNFPVYMAKSKMYFRPAMAEIAKCATWYELTTQGQELLIDLDKTLDYDQFLEDNLTSSMLIL